MTDRFDAIILGSGQGGNPLAVALANAGKKTAMVESKHLGGTCVNTGCTPTKTMVASGRVAYLARRAADFGVRVGDVSVDMRVVRQRKRDIVNNSRARNEKRLTAENLQLIRGLGRFTGPKKLEIALVEGGTRSVEAESIFIDTGLRSAIPSIPGIKEVPTLNNESIMELDAVPEHLLVLGGGYVGLEFGQMFRRFGSRVTIVHQGHQLLDQEDADVAAEVHKILSEDGIEILLNARTTQVSGGAGKIQMQIYVAGGQKTVTGSHLLLAVGRVPNTDSLQLEKTGVALDQRGFVKVNDRLETNVPGIYGIGNVNGGPAFTHISYDDYRILQANLIEDDNQTTAGRMVPYTVYIDPQLGRVGLTEGEARRRGENVRIAKMSMTYVARALETAESRGFMKIVVDAETELMLGAAILGIEGGETASAIQLAMMGGLKFTALRDGIFAHPTLAEALNNVFFHWEDEK
jgi:pyruvate/2-oxoglutarate dehydrogenase complex dihydrolipoamide dehydrogenase (E3) component